MNATAMIAAATSPALRPNQARPAANVAATVATPKTTVTSARGGEHRGRVSANHVSTPPRWMTLKYAASM